MLYVQKNVSLHINYVQKNVDNGHFYVQKNVNNTMERLVLQQLKEWKERKDRKPLIVNGARQVERLGLYVSLPNANMCSFVCYIKTVNAET